MSRWRYLHNRKKAGVLEAIHRLLLNGFHGSSKIDFSHAMIDISSVRAALRSQNGDEIEGSH
jgi:hypothetical protein